jgi:mono/diheme cytochrome c family protein
MSYYVLKTVLGWLFLILGFAAVTSMLTIMGKQEKKIPAPTLRKIHRGAGILFFLLMLANAALGFRFWVSSGDTLSVRAVLHAVLALILVFILLLKVAIVKRFKNLLRYAPTLGMIVFGLGFVVFIMTGGYFTARSLTADLSQPAAGEPAAAEIPGDAAGGASLFAGQCAACHYVDSEETLFGPGLVNLLKKEVLPTSGRPATLENVKNQLLKPFRSMPAFATLSEPEMEDLLAYLKSL